jgi:hypothetical protein
MARDEEALFCRGDLGDVLSRQEEAVSKDVERYDSNRLLNTPVDDLCAYFVDKLRIEPISVADDSQITMDVQEATIDTRSLPDGRFAYGEHQPTIPATAFSFFVPFAGEADLFRYRPSMFTSNPPRATIDGSTLVLTFTVPVTETPDGVKSKFSSQVNGIRSYVNNVKSAVDDFNNNRLPHTVRRAIEERKGRLLRGLGVAASLGYPMRRREGMPTTHAAPSVRRKIAPTPPPASNVPFRPEPTLTSDDYEHILTVMQNMALVLERSPSAFAALGEEQIRWHFVVQLNGHYEGAATGETFNVEGKTDILVREGGKNIFIAECKFWSGPKGFQETIDQLLGYASWRDTKVAIVVFNRGVQFSTVLAKIPEELRSHQNFKREVRQEIETRFRAILSHKNDPSRELTMTVLAFDVPMK